jgi:hypothetical protein
VLTTTESPASCGIFFALPGPMFCMSGVGFSGGIPSFPS